MCLGYFAKRATLVFGGIIYYLVFWLRLHFSLYFSVKSSNVFCTFWWLFKLAALFSLPFLKWTTKTCRCIHLLQNDIARLLCWGIQASPSFFSVVYIPHPKHTYCLNLTQCSFSLIFCLHSGRLFHSCVLYYKLVVSVSFTQGSHLSVF